MCLYWIEAAEIFCVLTEDSRVGEMVGLFLSWSMCACVFHEVWGFFELITSVLLENDSDFTE